jgi:hypothetical protein
MIERKKEGNANLRRWFSLALTLLILASLAGCQLIASISYQIECGQDGCLDWFFEKQGATRHQMRIDYDSCYALAVEQSGAGRWRSREESSQILKSADNCMREKGYKKLETSQ